MSREHILPKWLVETEPENLTFSGVAKKVFKGHLQIHDVCKKCNNGTLSFLDSYVKRLWVENLSKYVLEGEEATFVYDYDPLLRWLLKVSFNAARAEKQGRRAFTPAIIRYIMSDGEPPEGTFIYLSLIKPTLKSDGTLIVPEARRCARIKERKEFLPWETFVIAMRSYQFLVSIQVDCVDVDQAQRYFQSIKCTMPGQLIDRGLSQVKLTTSHFHTLAAYLPHFVTNADKYQPYASERVTRHQRQLSQTTHLDLSIIPRENHNQ